MVGGDGRDVTHLMRGVPGLMAKDGAEGVFAAALPDGRAVALKIADGASRARPPVMVAALRPLGVDVSAVEPLVVERDPRPRSTTSARFERSRRKVAAMSAIPFVTLDDAALRRGGAGVAAGPPGDRRQPVEVHLPRHGHVHHRPRRRRRHRSRPDCSTSTATRSPRRSTASGCGRSSSPTATPITRRWPPGCARPPVRRRSPSVRTAPSTTSPTSRSSTTSR